MSNARVQRGRERHSATDDYRTHGLRCNALLGDASNHQPCQPVTPSTLARDDGDHFTVPAVSATRTLWPFRSRPAAATSSLPALHSRFASASLIG